MSLYQRNSVVDTPEFRRIEALPRRTWTDGDLETLAEKMTALLKVPGGTMKLRPMQALALHDLYCHGGLAALMRVGSGKTLVSLLAPYMLNARRPMLLLPAALIDKTAKEQKILQKHWRIPSNIRMVSYEMLGRVNGANILTDWKPDLLIMDETHRLKHKKVGRTRRVARYLKENPTCKVAAMSGTFMKHSLKDYAHIVRWCLPDPPVPMTDGEVSEWADCIDEKVPALVRRGPGALLELCSPEERAYPPIQAARLGFQRRLVETPGVITSAGDQVSCSLIITALPYTLAPCLEKYYTDLRNGYVTPDGWDLMSSIEIWACARQMAVGMHLIWDPRPPEPWRVTRKIWAKFVRDELSSSHTLDTELQVKHACARGDLPDHEYQAWVAMEPTFDIHTKAVWHDDAALKICEEWMKEPGIVWCEHVAFAKELAKRTGAEYYRQDGCNEAGQSIENADCSTAIIASFASNKEGRNLQGRDGWKGFCRNLVTSPPAGADDWEQMVGRTHRDGQLEDEVTVDVLLGCREHLLAWHAARAGAEAARDTLGQTQKILLADCVGFPSELEMQSFKGAQWNAPPMKKLLII